jgi:hypothetical protein
VDISPYERLRAFAARQNGLVTAAQAIRGGLSRDDVHSRLRRGEWRAIARGVYLLDADVYGDDLPPRTLWRAALLLHGDDACLAGATAAAAYGLVGLPPGPRDVEVALIDGPSRHRCPTKPVPTPLRGADVVVVVRQLPVTHEQVVTVDGFRVRDAFHTVLDAALGLDRPSALALLDSALHTGVLSPAELTASLLDSRHRRGIVAVRALAELADGRAESQVESRVRLACIDGDVPPDELQYVVRGPDGHVIAIGDTAWLAGRRRPLIGEADGTSVHSTPQAIYRDRWRGNALVGEACDTIRFTYADTLRRGYIAAIVKAALRAA